MVILSLLGLCSCSRDGLELTLSVGPCGPRNRRVLVFYEAGFNTLGSSIRGNIQDLEDGFLPERGADDDVLLVFCHVTRKGQDYAAETAPVMIRLYSRRGEPRADTLKVWPVGTPVANKEMMKEVFDWVRDEFPAAGYGAVLGSHASGWLPKGYYANPKEYEGYDRGDKEISWRSRKRTFGQEYYSRGTETEEMDIGDLARAIPYRLDYVLFDACLMGSVEVLWAMKDVCDYCVAAPTEIPGPGFDYATLAEHLLQPGGPDLRAVCEDYYSLYAPGGRHGSFGACLTLADCRQMDGLAEVCRGLFDQYRVAIRTLDGRSVQAYGRPSNGFQVFFDLKDLLREAGATAGELSSLQASLDKVVLYETHTEKTTYSPALKRVSGLSMYLPSYPDYRRDDCHGTPFLDGFYKNDVSWNVATGLVGFLDSMD